MLPHFAQSLGACSLTSLGRWGNAPSLRSVAGGMFPRFAQSLGECCIASLSRWGDAASLRSVAGGMLHRFAQLLGGRSLASLSRFPFNGSIKLLQNLHSRGSMKQHFTFGSLVVGTSITCFLFSVFWSRVEYEIVFCYSIR